MSLKSYLFILVATLVLLLGFSQLAFISWLQDNINQEIEIKARDMSSKAIDVALHELSAMAAENDHNIKSSQFIIKQNVEAKKLHIDKLQSTNAQPTQDNASQIDKEITVFTTNDVDPTQLTFVAKEIKVITEKLQSEVNRNITNQRVDLGNKDGSLSGTWSFSTIDNNDVTDKLINNIQYLIIASSLLALILAYWLSAQFNKPLISLTRGFKALAEGNYDIEVKEHGIDELKDTIHHFNQMKNALKTLSHLEKNNRELQHLAELGEVSKGLAHALRNPMHTIGLALDKLSNTSLDEIQRQTTITLIQNKIIHLNKTINALLHLSTTGINRTESVPLKAVILDVLLEYKSSEIKNLSYQLNVDDDLTLLGAETEIRTILHTLIFNACESSDNPVSLIINASLTNDDALIITIEDFGSGLANHIKDKLFQPHVSTKPEGAGMGLYMAKRLISLYYHGDLNLVNKETGGCIATAMFKMQEPS